MRGIGGMLGGEGVGLIWSERVVEDRGEACMDTLVVISTKNGHEGSVLEFPSSSSNLA